MEAARARGVVQKLVLIRRPDDHARPFVDRDGGGVGGAEVVGRRGDEALERLVAVPLLSGLRRDLSPWYGLREPFQSAGGIEKGCTEAAGCSA